jgi:hypothetical protein
MKFEPQILKYLNGESFQTSLTVDLEKTGYEIIPRETAITELIKNSNVVHIGCSDHIEVINEKIATNTWLHKLITDNSNNCIGIDIDRESIAYIKNNLGYTNVFQGDILTDDFDGISQNSWDYVVFGEIMEHIGNPVNFLKVFKERFGENIEKFIITVPSIYNKRQFGNMLKFKEIINSDHRFWFTPYTISKIVSEAGYKPENITFSNLQKLTVPELIIRKLKRLAGIRVKYPFYYFNTIIISGKIK